VAERCQASEGTAEGKSCRKSGAFHPRTKPRVGARVKGDKTPGVKALVPLPSSGYTEYRRSHRP
jgi:hypothetical protein